MEVKIIEQSTFCELAKFTINGIKADYNDFGIKEDLGADDRCDDGCDDMTFIPIQPEQKVLEKYNISELEYNLIAKKLTEALSFGYCNECS